MAEVLKHGRMHDVAANFTDFIPHVVIETAAKAMHAEVLAHVRAMHPKIVAQDWDEVPQDVRDHYMDQTYRYMSAGLKMWPGLEVVPFEEGSDDHKLVLPLAEHELEETPLETDWGHPVGKEEL